MTTARLRTFVQSYTRLVDDAERAFDREQRMFSEGKALLAELISHDDWLPAQCAIANPQRQQQYLLHCDALERFSVVSFVWGPGQSSPVHDHTVWGMMGVLRGAQLCEKFAIDIVGALEPKGRQILAPGKIDLVSPKIGDIQRVSNAQNDGATVSIHVYGGNIGTLWRHVYDPLTGQKKPFISPYANALLPNLWDGQVAPHASAANSAANSAAILRAAG